MVSVATNEGSIYYWIIENDSNKRNANFESDASSMEYHEHSNKLFTVTSLKSNNYFHRSGCNDTSLELRGYRSSDVESRWYGDMNNPLMRFMSLS